jgi:hypothetical protein
MTVMFFIVSLLSPIATQIAYAQDGGLDAQATPTDEVVIVVDTDGDGVEDAVDPTPNGDTDGDGIDNMSDPTPNGEVPAEPEVVEAPEVQAPEPEPEVVAPAPEPVTVPEVVEAEAPAPVVEAPEVVEEPTDETATVFTEVSEVLEVVPNASVSCVVAENAAPWIASDLADYPPGALVTLSGGSWVPGQTVEIFVDDDGVADAEMGPWSHSTTVAANDSGQIFYQFNLPDWFVEVYSVVATGECSNATTTFTDARVVTTATLNSSQAVSVAPNASINAAVTVRTDGNGSNGRWNATGWRVSTSAPGSVTCVDHANYGAGTNSVNFPISAPSDSGTYHVYFIAYSDDACTNQSGGGAPSVTFGMQNALTVTQPVVAATLTLDNLIHTYDGTAKAARVTTSPAGISGVEITYTDLAGNPVTSPTNAGTYKITATLSNPSYTAALVTGDLVINKATASLSLVEADLAQSFGATKAVGVTVTPTGLEAVSVTYNGSTTVPTAPDNYAVVASLTNPNYAASNATGTLVISPATATLTLGNLTGHTYDGRAKAATVTTSPAGLEADVTFTYNGASTAPTAAGTYDVVATLDNDNYTGTASGQLVIKKTTAELTLTGLAHTYDGGEKSASVKTAPEGLGVVTITYDGTATAPTAAGTYEVVATLTNENYTAAQASGDLVISPATSPLEVTSATVEYDDSEKSVEVTGAPQGVDVLVTYNGSEDLPVNAGIYTVEATLVSGNYSGTATGTLEITKATATLSLTDASQVYTGDVLTATIDTVPSGLDGPERRRRGGRSAERRLLRDPRDA